MDGPLYDCIVVGAGPAGLSASLFLARYRKQLRLVRFADNSTLACDALFFNLGTVASSTLHENLGCRLSESGGLVWVDEEQQTSVRRLYAAGDITPHSQLAVVAAAEGAMAAIHIHKSLLSVGELSG